MVPSIAGAAPVSLLSGKTVKTGTNANNPIGTTNAVTDNSTSTSFLLKADISSPTINDFLIYEFSTAQNIDKFKIYLKNTNAVKLSLIFYDGSGNKLFTTTEISGDSNIYSLPERISGVKKAVIWNNGTVDTNVYEWDLYTDVIPNTPLNLIADPDNTKINLVWDSVPDARNYSVSRSVYAGGPYELIKTGIIGNSYMDLNVVEDVTYYYVVTAFNNAGNSTNSNEASATLQTQIVPEPELAGRALLTIYISGGQIKEYELSTAELSTFLNWYDAKDAGSGPAKYKFIKTWNKGPFKARTEYVIFDKILTFDVDEYDVVNP
jgi:hypothetical protein